VIGGVSVFRQLQRAGLVDELLIDVMPVFLGDGVRLFEGAELVAIRLEKVGVEEVGARTTLRFRVRK
jgi:dihydrofolate reductase